MIARNILIGLVKFLVGASPRWVNSQPSPTQSIYFANHTSHVDTIALWSALPSKVREVTRPVAAADYWGHGLIKRYVALKVLNAVLIHREKCADRDPLEPLSLALEDGASLIFFPEGTRQPSSQLGNFKSGLFHLARRYPNVRLIPVYLDNVHRSLPKGTIFPVPMICTVRLGAPLTVINDETKSDFLIRAREAVIQLSI